MPQQVNFNGKIVASATPLISAGSRGLRYGDGLFETMKMMDGKIVRQQAHCDRLFSGLKQLQFELPATFTPDYIMNQVIELARINKMENLARIRLNVFRGNGGLFDPEDMAPNYIIETSAIAEHYLQFNESGLEVDICHVAKKSCDAFSQLKSNNYLPYVMAALHARSHQLNDCILLNQHGRICESTIANVFIIQNGTLLTPPLSEGCVAGTARQYLLNNSPIPCREMEIPVPLLLEAEEMFLTNAVYGLRWVKKIGKKEFTCSISSNIYYQLFRTN